jgi:hypothetical protein
VVLTDALSWEIGSPRATFEVSVTGEQIDPLLPRRRIDNGIGSRQLVSAVQVGRQQCDRAAKAQFCWQSMRLIVKIWPLSPRDTVRREPVKVCIGYRFDLRGHWLELNDWFSMACDEHALPEGSGPTISRFSAAFQLSSSRPRH